MVCMNIKLKSLKTGLVYSFSKQKEVNDFLLRGRSYMYWIIKSGKPATHSQTGEAFLVKVVSFQKEKRKPTCSQGKFQKCVSCARCYGLCSWSRNYIPVDGWTATKSYDADGNHYSYQIDDCPLYEEDESTAEKRAEQYSRLRGEYNGGKTDDKYQDN